MYVYVLYIKIYCTKGKYEWLKIKYEKRDMTGNGHIELLKVTRYSFQPSRARLNSYIKLQASVLNTSLPKYPTFLKSFPIKLLLYSIFFNEWKSVRLSLLV